MHEFLSRAMVSRFSLLASCLLASSLLVVACQGEPTETIDSLQHPPPSFVQDDAVSAEVAERLSHEYLADPVMKLTYGVDEVWTQSVRIDDRNQAHVRVMQTVDNIPVLGGQAIVHLDRNGIFKGVTDGFVRFVDVDTTPTYQDYEAIDLVVDLQGGWDVISGQPEAELMIVRHEERDHLAYRVRSMILDPADPRAPSIPTVFLDARTGVVLWQYDDLQTIRSRNTHDAMNGLVLPGVRVRGEFDGPIGDQAIDNAHDHAGVVYDFYRTEFGRDSYDGQGSTMISSAHFFVDYNNAAWTGSQMVYGDGDGTTFLPLSQALDIVAHELTHAVTDSTSDLIYRGESGAINEGMSDIFAAAIEHWQENGRRLAAGSVLDPDIWRIGEDVYTPGTANDALRDMSDPALEGDRDNYPDRFVGTSDNFGVHSNSGMINLAFYLLVNGGSHPRGKNPGVVVNGIGMAKALGIFYRAQTNYMVPFSNFENVRYATAQAAADVSDAAAIASVHAAWDAVGVPGTPAGSNPAPGECLASFERFTGTLASPDERANEPGGSYFYARYGYHEATLEGPPGTDFDLYLLRWDGDSWITVASSTTSESYELVNYLAYTGYYALQVHSFSGSGDYTICLKRPASGF